MMHTTDIASYADNNNPFSKLQKASIKLFKWFHENGINANQDKCHFLSRLDICKKILLPALAY